MQLIAQLTLDANAVRVFPHDLTSDFVYRFWCAVREHVRLRGVGIHDCRHAWDSQGLIHGVGLPTVGGFSGSAQERELPYPSRVFGLPKTHVIEHSVATSPDHLEFHVWALSFFLGIRLTTTEAGFLDATPSGSGMLVDFRMRQASLVPAVALAEDFWHANHSVQHRSKQFAAAVHALFLSQAPRGLEVERFLYLYAAIDACYALAKSLTNTNDRHSHAARIQWLCEQFDLITPAWAQVPQSGGSVVSAIRNFAVHEALFMDDPLGFAVSADAAHNHITDEMTALLCRLLVVLLGAGNSIYARTSVDTGQKYPLDLC